MNQPAHEHEFEAAPGLPEPLPPGERVLWQGMPDPARLAQTAFHLRGIIVYFALMLALRGAYVWSDTGSAGGALTAMLWLLPAPAFAVGMLAYLGLRLLPPRWHLAVLLVTMLLALGVGLSRIILRVHYASDVAAGFASGTTWLAVCITGIELGRWLRHRGRRS